MANLIFFGKIGHYVGAVARCPEVIGHAQSRTGHLVGGPFALSSIRVEIDQQIERMVALRELRIATIVIPRLMKFIC